MFYTLSVQYSKIKIADTDFLFYNARKSHLRKTSKDCSF
ncbi:hypothetical protein TREVI0001_2047 [Treponema vincentii ATCC 35580]|uniref:Uncharacterized protein n=1 Tax=Treponema vincentii ATCC 35580 TaxID=596324 RepID=C8PQE3_9SPIR|nr:hypothetical protein TREVI0001_2047 [Treponema vincentii ATCC 35580]